MAKIIYMDLNRCIYCRACEVACEREHDGVSRIFVTLIDERISIPLSCRHCEKSPCLNVCPTSAIEKVGEAIIQHTTKCIGCSMCAVACPFGVISFDSYDKVVKKCDLCQHRREENKLPACVTTCPTSAIEYEEYDKIFEKIRRKTALNIVMGISGEKDIVVTLPQK